MAGWWGRRRGRMKGEEGRAVDARTKGWYTEVCRGLSRFCGSLRRSRRERKKHQDTRTHTYRCRYRRTGKKEEEEGEKAQVQARGRLQPAGCARRQLPTDLSSGTCRSGAMSFYAFLFPTRRAVALPDAKIIIAFVSRRKLSLSFSLSFSLSLQTFVPSRLILDQSCSSSFAHFLLFRC